MPGNKCVYFHSILRLSYTQVAFCDQYCKHIVLYIFFSDYSGESHIFGFSHQKPTAVSEQFMQFKSEKLGSMDSVDADIYSSSSCVLMEGPEFTSKQLKRDSPLSHITSESCDHNGGILISKDGDLKLTIPEGAIKDGDSVILSLASDFYGPFVIPSKYQADAVSPYYWIGVSGSYLFQKLVQVEFQHFAVVTACDPSHFQLLYCKDGDDSYTMQPSIGCSLNFTVQNDISWCTFYTDHFCSYCLVPNCEDPIVNRIAAIYLQIKNVSYFTTEIWFSFPINQCMKRNKELYTKQGMVLDHKCSYIFEAPCDKSSTHFFTLTYHQDIDGWSLRHCRSKKIETKQVNFYNYYKSMEELKTIEDCSLFPQRFVINVTKKSECNTDLNTEIMITLYRNEEKILDLIPFFLFVPISAFGEVITNRQSLAGTVKQIRTMLIYVYV